MTHTTEPMTLEQVAKQHDDAQRECLQLRLRVEELRNNLDAELAKQREAEPVGEVRWKANYQGSGMIEVQWEVEPIVGMKLYANPQQRNAVAVSTKMSEGQIESIAKQCGGRFFDDDDGIDDCGGVILTYDELRKFAEAITALCAVASRDREDAERYRYLRDEAHAGEFSHYTGGGSHGIYQDEELDKRVDAARRKGKL